MLSLRTNYNNSDCFTTALKVKNIFQLYFLDKISG